jgi:hypothetical protein
MKPHHKLKVWKKSRNFVKHIYELTSKLPDAEKFGLTSQMRRAAILQKGQVGITIKSLFTFYESLKAALLNLKLRFLSAKILGILKTIPSKHFLMNWMKSPRWLSDYKNH